MDGLLVIDKPAGPTSHDVVVCLRRVLGESRIGHTGTLDPAASGVLPLVLGRATRLARFLSASDKSYEAVIRLGVATDTYDGEGSPLGPAHDGSCPSREAIEAALGAFRGGFLQQPPAYSAKKIAGRRSYKIARASARGGSGREGARDLPDPVHVIVHRLDLVGLDGDTLTLRVDCSAGFYVRALAHDLGQRLGSGAHLAALRRTSSGDFTLTDALSFEAAERDADLARAAIVPLAQMLPRWSSVVLTDEGARRVAHGRDVGQTTSRHAPCPMSRRCYPPRRDRLSGCWINKVS